MPIMNARISLLAACIAATCGCGRATAQTTPRADSAAPPAMVPTGRVPRNPNLITAAEIEGQSPTNAYDLIRRLRPRWIRLSAGDYSAHRDQVWVYLDGTRLGQLSELGRISSESIGEIRFVPGDEAVQRWGWGYSAGAILITSR